ncbi:MAG: PQQ-binding-like beta-propeller repeat protein [Rhodospirillaceae bacterium]|nr:PQQ-binding-like beta-propeller repeat protein [Rhodospirillaceae bacterium]
MKRKPRSMIALLSLVATSALAQVDDFQPISEEMMENPDPSDWLMINRTYDQQRFSPLEAIDRGNVAGLALAWSRGLPPGTQETTPIVYDGVMYLAQPGASVLAVDATTGDELWTYRRRIPEEAVAFVGRAETARTKNIAIFDDMIYYPAPDGFLVALDAATGDVRWETRVFEPGTGTQHTGGVLVADGKVLTNRTCRERAGCFIAAHDARSGEELWRFYNTAAPGTRDGDTWGDVPVDQRIASSWGLPGSYDPQRGLTYWGIANPTPYTRLTRHGSPEGTAATAPADLYSNSTVALDIDTGELAWYFQHLPGDDWDLDHPHERTVLTTRVEPDPNVVKWINPGIERGEEREVVASVGEGGGIFVMDRATGEFLWAMPFPYDVPEFHIADINVETGSTMINYDRVFKQDGDRALVCYHNTRSFWSTAYDPTRNALYIPFHDACLDMTANAASPSGFGPRNGVLRPGVSPDEYAAIAKVDLATGRMERIHAQAAPGNGSALLTGGDLLFWGDLERRFNAFDADTGEILWRVVLGGIVQTSTISYAVDGRQYVAVMTGNAQSGTATPTAIGRVRTVQGHNEIYAFALPED